jgi:hypothetical protein
MHLNTTRLLHDLCTMDLKPDAFNTVWKHTFIHGPYTST